MHTVGEGEAATTSLLRSGLPSKDAAAGRLDRHPAVNLHRLWDGTLIKATAWSWGACIYRLEGGVARVTGPLKAIDANNAESGIPKGAII